MCAEFGVEENSLAIKRQKETNLKKFSKGFDLLTSFMLNLDANLELLRKDGTPDEVRKAKLRIEEIRIMKSSLEKGDPKPTIVLVINMIDNNLRFIRDYSMKDLSEESNRFEAIKDLVDILEQLKKGE